ncbi:Pyruvate dehydrogenase complex protein X component, mitochondrial [Exophiala dermatitidis]|uniref:Pyruvate dehydrogenase E2 component (Dihydrolipoamide acetyltransferase) n=2 Tax=Exophiala dermatitidis TaxID=5970 RepID=H6C104_EXODN|nr:pyruvate dehydrogenase E2 component (dihydrolipoamide acetyltransferase) [Exophiala dermatitidis NIH/UT8656]EHY57341.1 pyruvate dehydrogenase E2 component (dihydrolipoamide acetyltransferase) [Exophiala dermatitidis NIH/UT8656]
MAGRQSVRQLARQLTSSHCAQSQRHARRTFSSVSRCLAAHNFMMPAMSPTMTEGNIATWKVKEGDSFSAGDVLLEIETDKASMDVEAQDDGVMAKIFAGDGSKGIQVGTRIAVLADPGDDISSLEIPPDDAQPVRKEADNVKSESGAGAGRDADSKYETSGVEKEVPGTPQNKRPAKDKPTTSPTGAGQNPKYPLYPSVIALIHENHIPDEEVKKIPATGPNGRLLKGDVLAYLGTIDRDYTEKLAKRLEHLEQLDLSNIKILQPASPPTAAAVAETAATPAAAEEPKVSSVSLTISLAEVLKVQQRVQETLGVTVPLSNFLVRAVDLANDDLPRPKGQKPSADELFNSVLGLDSIPKTSRGAYLPQIDALPVERQSHKKPTPQRRRSATTQKPDIIDILSGRATSSAPTTTARQQSSFSTTTRRVSTADGALNVFSLTVPQGEEKRARTFLERIKTVLQVEPGKLLF